MDRVNLHQVLAALSTLLAIAGLSGCIGDEDEAGPASGGQDAERILLEAHSTLEEAARDVPKARLPRPRGEIIVVGAGEKVASPPGNPDESKSLLAYFGSRGIALGTMIPARGSDPGSVLNALEAGRPKTLTLIVSSSARDATAQELIESGALFASLSASGESYCMAPGDSGAHLCQPTDVLPEGEPQK